MKLKEILNEISQFKRDEIAHELRHEDEGDYPWRDELLKRGYRTRSPFRSKPRFPGKVRQYLNVPYAEKEEAKRMGAQWDAVNKAWWMPVTPGQRWEPAGYEHWWKTTE